MYIYIVNASMAANLDFSFVSEMTTRWSMILSSEGAPFLADMNDLLGEEQTDWYLVGMRWGILWKLLFDVKITS